MSASPLRDVIAELGTTVRVEERGRVALVTWPGMPPLDAALRRRIVAAARQQGFSNVCIELIAPGADPSLMLGMTTTDADLSGD